MKKVTRLGLCAMLALLAAGCNERVVFEESSNVTCSGDSFKVCSDVCTDIRNDNENCGDCGIVCESGTSCKSGNCAQSVLPGTDCAAGLEKCDGICYDLMSSNENCSQCGVACGEFEKCVGGKCEVASTVTCSGSLKECDGRCYDLNSDPNNCGECGHKCDSDETCKNAECVDATVKCENEPYTTNCGDVCVDTTGDANNCGACGVTCESDQTCSESKCVCSDDAMTLCNGKCVDITSDANNCGACGASCGDGKSCSESQCVCTDTSLSLCGDACIDVQTDNNNCGACGVICGTDQNCTAGKCVSETTGCVDGYKTVSVNGASLKAYCIGDLETLTALRDAAGKAYPADNADNAYVLTADIDLGSNTSWGGILFTNGTFVGDGHTISSTKLSCNAKNCGIFSAVTDSTITDLTINVLLGASSLTNVGALAGIVSGSTISNVKAVGSGVSGNTYVGGLIGFVKASALTGCSATLNVTGTESVAGGLVGTATTSTTISNCSAAGQVKGGNYVGGLVGDIDNGDKVVIKNSYATGSVTGTGTAIGGLVGRMLSSTVEHSFATGDVMGKNQAGGLVGVVGSNKNLMGHIYDSAATGRVEATNGMAGGLVGELYSTKTPNDSRIKNCFALGNVAASTYAAGILGSSTRGASGSAANNIDNVYATGTVLGATKSALTNVGDKAGLVVSGYYWDAMWESMPAQSLATGSFSYVSNEAVVESSPLVDKLNELAADTWVSAKCLIKSGPASSAATYTIPVLKSLSAQELEILGCE